MITFSLLYCYYGLFRSRGGFQSDVVCVHPIRVRAITVADRHHLLPLLVSGSLPVCSGGMATTRLEIHHPHNGDHIILFPVCMVVSLNLISLTGFSIRVVFFCILFCKTRDSFCHLRWFKCISLCIRVI